MILYSFIIPTYNRAYCIDKTIQSILAQSYHEYEILIIDDGSTDNTEQLIANYTTKDSITYIRLENNQGVNIAKNTGAKLAHGKYLIFLDSDDILISNDSLPIINQIIVSNHKPALLMFSCRNLDGSYTSEKPDYNGFLPASDYLRGKVRGEYLPVVRADVFKLNYFFEDILGGEHLTWQRIAFNTDSLFISAQPVRLYNNTATDRLSFANKKFYARLLNVFIKDFKINLLNYLRYYPKGIVHVFSKIIYYKLKVLL